MSVRSSTPAHVTGPTGPAWDSTVHAELSDEPLGGPRRVCFDMERFHKAVLAEQANANQREAQQRAVHRHTWESMGYAQGIAHGQRQWFMAGVLVGTLATGVAFVLVKLQGLA